MKNPSIILRCSIEDKPCVFTQAGLTVVGPETGDQLPSLKRIFASGEVVMHHEYLQLKKGWFSTFNLSVQLLAGKNFDFKEYLPYLKQLVKTRYSYYALDVWFDIENDVLWTTGSVLGAATLLQDLCNTKENWEKKKRPKKFID
ncbi:MAG TPA: hypothetical protein P5056_01830 [Candidatus Paceibacterota bacterium]|nr:hypothetical protein [Candidatus Paceibacterota bacterium]